jgi:sortase A
MYKQEVSKDNELIGNIIIDKINLDMPLYNINSKNNNIEKNVTILKESILPPSQESIIFLAAHSGTSKISYFDNLDKLNINDTIILTINNKKYTYQIKNIYKQKKNGYININKEKENQLILTTCDPNNDKYQLIINSIKKEFT